MATEGLQKPVYEEEKKTEVNTEVNKRHPTPIIINVHDSLKLNPPTHEVVLTPCFPDVARSREYKLDVEYIGASKSVTEDETETFLDRSLIGS